MTESTQPEPTDATLPKDVSFAPVRIPAEETEFNGFERRVDIDKRTVRLRANANRNIVFVLPFEELRFLAQLTTGDDQWREVQ